MIENPNHTFFDLILLKSQNAPFAMSDLGGDRDNHKSLDKKRGLPLDLERRIGMTGFNWNASNLIDLGLGTV